MYTKHLSVNELYPPFASGGLWQMLRLVLSAGIRHHPPEVFGGANFCCAEKLNNIHHSSTKRIDTFIYGGLRKKIYGFEKNKKNLYFSLAKYKVSGIISVSMKQENEYLDIEEQLREEINASQMSRYQISRLSGVTEAQLSMFLNHKRTLNLSSAAKIACLLGLELQKQDKYGKEEVFKMEGRKKPEAEKIQLRISQRLSKLYNERQLEKSDYDFLWKWTHELFKLALSTE